MPHTTPDLTATVLDLLLDAVCVVDEADRFVYVSGAYEPIFGYTAEELIGKSMYDLLHPEDRAHTVQAAAEVAGGTLHLHFRNRYVRKDGSVVHLMWAARKLKNGMRLGVARDVTALVQAEALHAAVYAISEAAHTVEDLPALFHQVHTIVDGLVPTGGFVVALRDEGSGRLAFPYVADGVDGEPGAECAALCEAVATDDETKLLALTADDTSGEWLALPLRSPGGVMGALAIRHSTPGARHSGKECELLQYVCAQIATAAERKQTALRLRHLALHDSLTGLANRELFSDRLENALVRARRQGARVGLAYIDLDGFKQVNDRYGHPGGDALLCETAQRLRRSVRDSDTVGRIGGDEFVVVLDGVGTPGDAFALAAKLREALSAPYAIGEQTVVITPSVGLALYPDDGLDNATLLRHADAAMYEEKRRPNEVPAD